MTKVLSEINKNKLMIGFIVVLLIVTIYAGINERNLQQQTSNYDIVLK